MFLLLHAVVRQGEHGKFPDMRTLRIHFTSILHRGFQAYREPLEVCFPVDTEVNAGQSVMSKVVSAVNSFRGIHCMLLAIMVNLRTASH